MESPAPLQRRRLIPLWAIIVPSVVLVVGIGFIVALVYRQQTSLVSVPNISNLDVAVARSRLLEQGLLLKRGDKRFSPSVPVDGVIDQTPAPGDLVPRGTEITVIISAGSESFPMPDVSGLPLQTARESLQAKGLVVQTEVVASSRPKNTVVSSTPVAGVTVSSSGVVKLTISSGTGGSSTLRPADLSRRVFVIDPAPPGGAASDTPMEIQRRLFSLLEAAGAKVYVTRVVTDATATLTPDTRAQRARTTSATAVVGLDVRASGAGGFTVTTMRSLKVSSAAYLGSVQVSQALVKSLGAVQPGVRPGEASADPVLQANDAPGARVVVGSATDKSDVAHFADPAWEDRVAAAIYGALANVYGSK